MKITVEGEPKEIAALELALKNGNQTVRITNQTITEKQGSTKEPVECPRKWD